MPGLCRASFFVNRRRRRELAGGATLGAGGEFGGIGSANHIGAAAVSFQLGFILPLAAVCPCMVLVPGPHLLNGMTDLVQGQHDQYVPRLAVCAGGGASHLQRNRGGRGQLKVQEAVRR